MRHGDADSSGDRHLSHKGFVEVSHVLKQAKRMGLSVNAIRSSPLIRARETAEIARETFGIDYTVTNSLEPEGSPPEIYEELSTLKGTVLLVSHKPLVSQFLSDILGKEMHADFSTGTLAVVSGDPKQGGCIFVSMIPPKIPGS